MVILRDRAIGGFEVTARSDLSAGEMRSAIREFCLDRTTDDLTLLYITGHGARADDGQFVFVATDTAADRLAETGVRAETVNEALEDCFAGRRVAVFDTCESGSFAIGFRVSGPQPRGAATTTARRSSGPPLTPKGVYVLASCDAAQSAYEGGGTVAEPEPSVFTGAMIEILRSGSAGTSAQGAVSVDDLFESIVQSMRGADPPQNPVKSAFRVSGAIPIAARPQGGAVMSVARMDRASLGVVPDGTRVPDRSALIGYYADVVRSEHGRVPLLSVRGGDHVVVHGAERALCGVVDADGCIPVPEGSEQLIRASRQRYGPELWMGWPSVVVYPQDGDRRPALAPLLIRHVEVVDGPDGARLRADGAVLPHPGLMAERLDPEDAEMLRSSYRTSWHHGEYDRMAFDAGQLLEDTYGLPCVEALRPGELSDQIDLATAGEGARNVAMLFSIEANTFTTSLLKDLEHIGGNPTTIENTALITLYPGGENPPTDAEPMLVTPLPANSAQRAVLRSAMTRRLTVATGPPGTGKSQLVADVVATVVAAGQTVLVASTNNEAVDEVHRRCARIAPGMLVRTGSSSRRPAESAELDALSASERPRPNIETRRQALVQTDRTRDALDERLAATACAEQELLNLARSLRQMLARLGRSVAELDQLLGDRWRDRAGHLSGTPWFGSWRRRRFLAPLSLPKDTDTADYCAALGELATLNDRYRRASALSDRDVSDCDREEAGAQFLHELTQAATELVAAVVADRATKGARAIRELAMATGRLDPDWDERDAALSHVRGWAVTNLAARRFRTSPAIFDLVIVDEASQCTIPSVVPLLYRARRALMIGDAMQLPHISNVDDVTDLSLRARRDVSRDWLARHRLSPVRHSAFAAAERAVDKTLLLDEHYRCHPDIAAIPNRLFYQGRLAVLTDTAAQVEVGGPAIVWRHVAGRAERGPGGKSWRNAAEADDVAHCVLELLATLPRDATIGVVTPYRPQVAEITRRLRAKSDRVRIGTAHAFQGGERDVMVLSLVADRHGSPRRFDWADHQSELWNVAITRARAQLIVVGDREVWSRRGRIGGELVAAGDGADIPSVQLLDDDLVERLYTALNAIPDTAVELGVQVNGYRADAVLTGGGHPVPILLDPGPAEDTDPAAHLRRMLRRRALLGDTAVRLPAWLLYDTERLRRLIGR